MPLKDFTTSSYGDNKYSKVNQLNSSMSITNGSHDELTQKLRGGLTNGD